MIRSGSAAGMIVSSEARPNLVASISATVRWAPARAAVITSASGRREVVSPSSSVTPAQEMNAHVEVELGEELHGPAAGEHLHVLVELAGRHDHVDRLRLHLVGDRGRAGDQRQLVGRVVHQPPRQRQRASTRSRGRSVEPGVTSSAARVGDRLLRRARLLDPLRPGGRDHRQPSSAAGGGASARAPPWTRSTRPSRGQLLEVAVHGDRRDLVARGRARPRRRHPRVGCARASGSGAGRGARRSDAVLERSLLDRHVHAAELVDGLDEVVGEAR